MPRPGRKPGSQTPEPRTKLAAWRVYRGMSQQEVADAAGISLSTYRRQEWGDTNNPQIGVIVNLAYVLGCELEDLLEERWLRWRRLPTDRTVISPTKPSDPRKLWRENRTEIHREDQEPLAEKPLPPPPPD